jgi:hypothetical protein
MEVDELVAGVADRGGPVRFLDVHVEDVQADATVAADVLGERERLVRTVEEVGLEAVKRLEPEPDALLLGVILAFLEALDRPLPLILGRPHRRHLAHRRWNDREDLPVQLLGHVDRVLDVLDAAHADVLVLVEEVAPTHHQRDGSPALDPVLVEQGAHLLRVVQRRLAGDLDPVVAAPAEPLDRHLDRLGPHPVVHRHLECHVPPLLVRDPACPGS